jgi:hypothetical protein
MKLAEHPSLRAHLGRPAVLDSNLLLLHLCCEFHPPLVQSFKRLNTFDSGDAILLAATLGLFSTLHTTPHVLTEVSNLANSLPTWRKDSWCRFFAEHVGLIPEEYHPINELAADSAAMRFGLMDAALARLARTHTVMTIDWPLTGFLESRGLPVVNFNRLREFEFDS